MRETYESATAVERAGLAETLLGEVNALLTLTLGPPPELSEHLDEAMEQLTTRLERAMDGPECRHGVGETRALLAALTDDRDRPLRGFLMDLAEILFLPRERRSEYTTNSQVAEPYRVRKLLLEYALWSRRLDELVGILSKPFCARRCEKLPVGCCHILGYDLGLVPRVMLELQRLEAVRNGWRSPATEEHCRYHSPTGCVISLFKSPACVGYLCEPLTADLRRQRGGAALDRFLGALAVFNNCDLDRRKIFRAMEETVEAGRALLADG